MPDIVVTTPKREGRNAAAEAADVIAAGGGTYFRTITGIPPRVFTGDRVYYVQDGAVRGYAVISETVVGGPRTCDTTGREWPAGFRILMDATTWKWIHPIPMTGFRGWRYWRRGGPAAIGGWLDPDPSTDEAVDAQLRNLALATMETDRGNE